MSDQGEAERQSTRSARQRRIGPLLRAYLYSGWAFFIPYLIAYLLYAWSKWPVNGGRADRESWPVPSLLTVYWLLHIVHVFLAVTALVSWWREKKRYPKTQEFESAFGKTPTVQQPKVSLLCSIIWRLLPWCCLALVFWIPRFYLEWPSDPWEHLRRINEWHLHDVVMAHSNWFKSSYFLLYSLAGIVTGLTQLTWLNVYYTGICLLLSWQYFRLARTVGLSERMSIVFIILNSVTFGNNVFSFYRYYGLSSSILAQLCAVAATRIALEAMNRELKLPSARMQRSPVRSLRPVGHRLWAAVRRLGPTVLAFGVLLPLIAFNHVQGLALCALGVLAITAWRLIEFNRTMVLWLAGIAVALSIATVRWFPRDPAVDEIYRPQGWLAPWYGFSLLFFPSPAVDCAMQILGAFGVLNSLCGIWLIRKNHVVGWLTLIPAIVLTLPCAALPFVHLLIAKASTEDVFIFQRTFLAIPTGLALVVTFSQGWAAYSRTAALIARNNGSAIAIVGLLLILSLSPESSSYNRVWHCLYTAPNDFRLKAHIAPWTRSTLPIAHDHRTLVATSPLAAKIQEVFDPSPTWWINSRQIDAPLNSKRLEQTSRWFEPRSLMEDRLPLSSGLPPVYWFFFPGNFVSEESTNTVDMTAIESDWLCLDGELPAIEISNGGQIIASPIGSSCHIFSQGLIPVSCNNRYEIVTSIRQNGDPTATNYLAIAWFDKSEKLIRSNEPPPRGANNPAGWINGSYSYYGLANEPAAPRWTTYSISFGRGEIASIPENAAFLRAGALLNYYSTPNSKIQLKQVALRQKPDYLRCFAVAPSFQNLISPYSTAGLLSRHWSPHQAIWEQSGVPELRMAIAKYIETSGATID